MSLFSDALLLEEALTASPIDPRAALDAFVKVLYDVIGPAKVGAEVADRTDAKAVLARCAQLPPPPVAGEGDTVGKIGDGKILALILKFLPIVLSIL